MSILLTEGWRGSISTANNGGGLPTSKAQLSGWQVLNPGSSPVITAPSGTTTMKVSSFSNGTVSGGFSWLPRNPDNSMIVPNTFVIGFRGTLGPTSSTYINDAFRSSFFSVVDSTAVTSATNQQDAKFHISFFPNGTQLDCFRGSRTSGITLGTTSGSPAPADGAEHYYEFKVTIHSSAGSVVVKCDGTTILNLSGINTQGGSTALVGGFSWYSGVSGGMTLADIYLLDTNGANNNDFLGDVHVETKMPTSDGTYINFTPSTGTAHWSLVDELGGDNGDTDYVQLSGATGKDSYGHEAMIDTAGTVFGTVVYSVVKATDTGVRTAKSLIRSGGTDGLGTTYQVAFNTYSQVPGTAPTGFTSLIKAAFDTQPGGSAWTQGTINSAEIGIAS